MTLRAEKLERRIEDNVDRNGFEKSAHPSFVPEGLKKRSFTDPGTQMRDESPGHVEPSVGKEMKRGVSRVRPVEGEKKSDRLKRTDVAFPRAFRHNLGR